MLQIRTVLLLAAFAVAAAALGLTNARASSDEAPNGIAIKGMKLQADAQDADDDIEDIESTVNTGNADRGWIPGN